MFKIDPTALYTKKDLSTYLEQERIDIDNFLSRLGCKKKFRGLWFGEDLIEALRKVSPFNEIEEKTMTEFRTPISTKTRKTQSDDRLIGGIFNPSDLGIRKISGG